jgi:asparagine synthase (glutamine-hydrolysing)
MCGIAGIATTYYSPDDCVRRVEIMVSNQTHRGPDDTGFDIVNKNNIQCVFGHNRLAIIDLSSAGHQPMYDSDTGNWLVFNGEIYNYLDLKDELIKTGQRFKTKTDTEVILKAFAVWGVDCASRFRGIFAIALWSKREQQLILIRDQLGVKPLYYWNDDATFVFASEIRCLLSSGLVPRKLDYYGLNTYLSFGSLQEPYTLIKGVQSVDAGYIMIWDGKSIKRKCYWEIPASPDVPLTSVDNLFELIAEKIYEAIKIQLIADVPIGVFLSGGIDSSAIAGIMSKVSSSKVKSFSLVYKEEKYDERSYSRLVANRIRSDHTELILRGEDVRSALPKALASIDLPSVDGLNTYFISKLTRAAGLTVALSGVGGDELFGGYNGYSKALLAEKTGNYLNGIPMVFRNLISFLLYRFAINETMRKSADLFSSKLHPYFITRQLFGNRQISDLLIPEINNQIDGWVPKEYATMTEKTKILDPVNRSSYFEITSYMKNTLLRDTDQMSMAHALEIRVPLLDHKLVECLFSLSGTLKLQKGIPKPLLTIPLKKIIPDECIYRPKMGFELPFSIWFKESLQKDIEKIFIQDNNTQKTIFKNKTLNKNWEKYETGHLSWSRIWCIFVLSKWIENNKIEVN